MRATTATALATLALTPLLAGCAVTERSAKAYCDTYRKGIEQIAADHPELDPDQIGGVDPLLAPVSATSAWGDFVALTGELAKVAPDDIAPSVERVHDTLQKQMEALGDLVSDPFGTLLGQLVGAFANSGAFDRMDRWTRDHCGATA